MLILRRLAQRKKQTSEQMLHAHPVRGLQHLQRVMGLLDRLHACGTERDKAHNRTLFYDQYAALVLIHCFSPAMLTLRSIEQASEFASVKRMLKTTRSFSRSALSEAPKVFDPELLKEVIAELGKELVPLAKDPRLSVIGKTATLVDGTFLKALPRLAASFWMHDQSGQARHGWRMHTQFELDRHAVSDLHLTDYRNNTPQSDERDVLMSRLEKGRCYVIDRGYFKYELFDAIVDIGSDYVCRVKKHIDQRLIESRTDQLSNEAKEAGVIRDVVVYAGSLYYKSGKHPIRLVTVEAEVAQRGKSKETVEKERLLIATNRLDVPAEIVALLYRYRWTIELFFRFFKQMLGCRHLISDDPRGIAIQCYCTVIACMLLTLYSGRKPDIATWRMVNWYITGWATEEELLNHMNKPPPNIGIRQRQKDELWKKLGY
jgi:hypothetical protein